MRKRADQIGDVSDSAPDGWIEPLRMGDSHALLILASDAADDLAHEVVYHVRRLAEAGIALVYAQEGRVRSDDPGHEHFGFKDGISQPGIRGVTTPNNPADPNQGAPGQDLLQPGEFVLGYPTQPGPPPPTPVPSPAPYPVPANTPATPTPVPDAVAGPPSQSGPAWTVDGSYLVFRRLRQDVKGFRDFLTEQGAALGLDPGVFGAKLVGRYASGAPLERTKDQPATLDPSQGDPSIADPALLDDTRINNFEYGQDVGGQLVPRAAHIRKAYPRDQTPPGEATTQTHRLLRRGIPFGAPFALGASSTSVHGADVTFPDDRGLLFLCYQRSIADQFEFVQNAWVNNKDFPQAGDGHDPIIAQRDNPRDFALLDAQNRHVQLMRHWVTTTGGDYFFQPSIAALQRLSGMG